MSVCRGNFRNYLRIYQEKFPAEDESVCMYVCMYCQYVRVPLDYYSVMSAFNERNRVGRLWGITYRAPGGASIVGGVTRPCLLVASRCRMPRCSSLYHIG